MRKLVIEIYAPYGKPWAGMNEYQAACRSNKYQGAKLKRTYTEIAKTAAIDAAHKAKWQKPAGKVRVCCEWYEHNRRRDPDNIASGIKFVLDGLVAAGVISNDSQKYIFDMPVHHLSYDRQAGVRVTLITVDEGTNE